MARLPPWQATRVGLAACTLSPFVRRACCAFVKLCSAPPTERGSCQRRPSCPPPTRFPQTIPRRRTLTKETATVPWSASGASWLYPRLEAGQTPGSSRQRPSAVNERRRIATRTQPLVRIRRCSGRSVRARGHFPTEQAAMKCLYLAVRSLDPTGRGQQRWTNRWKPRPQRPRRQLRRPNRDHRQLTMPDVVTPFLRQTLWRENAGAAKLR